MSSKRRQIAKRRSPLTPKQLKTIEYNRLIQMTSTKVKQANARLKSLEAGGYRAGTWASKKLFDRLSQVKATNKNKTRIKIKRNLTNAEIRQINKAVNFFIASETSTKKGIKKVRNKTLKTIMATISTDTHKLTKKEAEFYYNMFGDKDFEYFRREGELEPSEIFVFIDEARERNSTESSFINRLLQYTQNPTDADVRVRASALYNKFIA